jgi:hypothetical protein
MPKPGATHAIKTFIPIGARYAHQSDEALRAEDTAHRFGLFGYRLRHTGDL